MKIDEIKNKDLEIEWDVTIPSKTVNNELEKIFRDQPEFKITWFYQEKFQLMLLRKDIQNQFCLKF